MDRALANRLPSRGNAASRVGRRARDGLHVDKSGGEEADGEATLVRKELGENAPAACTKRIPPFVGEMRDDGGPARPSAGAQEAHGLFDGHEAAQADGKHGENICGNRAGGQANGGRHDGFEEFHMDEGVPETRQWLQPGAEGAYGGEEIGVSNAHGRAVAARPRAPQDGR